MLKQAIISRLLPRQNKPSLGGVVTAFAPSNIALIKYWGKRDKRLNLPVTSSLSISLGDKGTTTLLSITQDQSHHVILNGKSVSLDSPFYQRLIAFLNLCRPNCTTHYNVETDSNIPIAAGLASSASGFAALVKALNELHQWHLNTRTLSILARMGSGSACRSLWHGFVEWQCGESDDGIDSYAKPLIYQWPNLRIGLALVSQQVKHTGSREAMNHTVATSKLYQTWPIQVQQDMIKMHRALKRQDFQLLGSTAESNAMLMHKTMLDSQPPVQYSTADTLKVQQKVRQLREQGIAVYFTQDAGPNIKLLFEVQDLDIIRQQFPHIQVVNPFQDFGEAV